MPAEFEIPKIKFKILKVTVMKNKISFFGVLLLLSFVACEKQFDQSYYEHSTASDDNKIEVEHGMLVFSDTSHFIQMYNQLEIDNSIYLHNFYNIIKSYKGDKAIEDFMTEKGLSEYHILEEFEAKFNYTSLRQKIADEMDEYNKIRDPGDLNSPEEAYISDEILQTLLNSNGEIKIGTSIYKIIGDNIVIKVLDNNYDIVNRITKYNYLDFKGTDNIIIYDNSPCKTTCKANVSNSITKFSNSRDRKLYLKISAQNVLWTHKIKVRMTQYYYDSDKQKWQIDYTAMVDGDIYGFYYEGTSCSSSNKKNLNDISQDVIGGQWGDTKIEKNIKKRFRVESGKVYLYYRTHYFGNGYFYLNF